MAKLIQKYNDGELLQKIAVHRDQEAFAELEHRHKNASYALARRITGQAVAAEEAVQEAMLRVWVAAGNFMVDGNARSWIMRTVARESINVLRIRRRKTAIDKKSRERPSFSFPRTARENAENSEVLRSLQRLLKSLPTLEHRLITLYYGGELSQDEIAHALHMPQRTVSLRIKKTLEHLRRGMTTAGHTSVPALTSILSQAVCAGYTASTDLGLRFINGHPRIKDSAHLPSVNQKASRFWQTALFISAAFLLIATVFELRSVAFPASDQTEFTSTANEDLDRSPAIHSTPANPSDPTKERPAFKRRWDFNRKDSVQEFNVITGKWHWEPTGGAGGSGCMQTDSEYFYARLTLKLPTEIENYKVISMSTPLKSMNSNGKTYSVTCGWGASASRTAIVRIGKINRFIHNRFDWRPTTMFISPHWSLYEIGSRKTLFISEKGSAYIDLAIKGKHRLDALSIQSILHSKLPDMGRYLASIKRFPNGKHQGKTDLTKTSPQKRDVPMTVEFQPHSNNLKAHSTFRFKLAARKTRH